MDISFFSVGQEPDIPDLIDYMQSGDETKIINAAGYLQHLCYSKEAIKDKVRYLRTKASQQNVVFLRIRHCKKPSQL